MTDKLTQKVELEKQILNKIMEVYQRLFLREGFTVLQLHRYRKEQCNITRDFLSLRLPATSVNYKERSVAVVLMKRQ
ncbi:hypothetical protein [uncultured Methanomethylovorans sp.]|uniref:hypothetical protein n=1 Tax=uncultured Methanomethylovorans sp. TaxID=183759 RepID=UPI002AA75117|nr:hypothetical protein [uncultured Methanomethylovorans sp.]